MRNKPGCALIAVLCGYYFAFPPAISAYGDHEQFTTDAHWDGSEALKEIRLTLRYIHHSYPNHTEADRKRIDAALKKANAHLKEAFNPEGAYDALLETNVLLCLLQEELKSDASRKDAVKKKASLLWKINDLLDQSVDKEMRKDFSERLRKNRISRLEGQAKDALGELRISLALYRDAHENLYPPDLSSFLKSRKYPVDEVASIEVGGHTATDAVLILRGAKTLKELEAGLTDVGGWAYVGDKDSPLFGALYINCTHKDSRGVKWGEY